MQLYGSLTSPYVRHCRIALIEEELDARFILTDQAASAQQSPTKRVPFLRDGELLISDSASILKYIREQNGRTWLTDIHDYDQFCLVNTLLDSALNLFFIEKAGTAADDNSYLQRQQLRIKDGLKLLNNRTFSQSDFSDSELRLGCFLSWGVFRQRITLDGLPQLQAFLACLEHYPAFAATAPTA